MRRKGPPRSTRALALLTLVSAGSLGACAAPEFPSRSISATADPTAPPCPDWRRARLSHPIDAVLGNPLPAETLSMGCVNDSNIEAMAVRERDLTGGGVTGRAPATSPALAVQRYQRNEVTPLPDRANRSAPF